MVAASIVGLFVGPMLYALGGHRANAGAALEGLTLGVVPTLVLLRLLPHVVEGAGPLGLGLFVLGYVSLWLADLRHHTAGDRIGQAIVVPALAVHALSDGAGLAVSVAALGADRSTAMSLALALMVHRLPEGLFITSNMQPRVGWRGTLARIALLAAATVVGSVVGSALMHVVPDAAFDAVVALGLGVMLRFAMHSHSPRPATRAARMWSGGAFLLGVALVLSLPDPDSILLVSTARELSLARCFGPMFVETAPSMLLGLLAAGFVHEFMPRKLTPWLRGGSALSQAVRGVAFGVPLPQSAFGVLPLTQRMLSAGVPLAAVASFSVGASELDLGGTLVSVRLLGLPLALVRALAGGLMALAVALITARAAPKLRMKTSAQKHFGARLIAMDVLPLHGSDETFKARAMRAVVSALGPSLDHVAAWYVLGLASAAALEAAVDPAVVTRLRAPFDVVASALLAVPIHVCAQGATPLAGMMVHKGMSVGAALSFMLAGSGTNVALMGVFSRAMGRRVAVAFGASVLTTAVVLGLVANLVVPTRTVPEVHRLASHVHVGVEWVFAAVLGGLIVVSVLRLGPRQWFGNMSPEA